MSLRRLYPLAAFLAGFVWDTLTVGQRVRVVDFWRLGAFLLGAAVLIHFLARREARQESAPSTGDGCWRERLVDLRRQAPHLLLQFFFGGIFSALFILYFKSSGHLGTWLMAALLGTLLIFNEFSGRTFHQRFTLIWLFALSATLLFNFALPHAAGSLNPWWFYVSTVASVALTHLVWWLAPGRPGRILPSWGLGGALLLAWNFDMVAPVPLVKQDLVVGHAFVQGAGRYMLQVERAPSWQLWRNQSPTVRLLEGEKLYGVSAVFAPLGVAATLEHRWEFREPNGWREVYRNRFQTTGGRERGFRGYSWVANPQAGEWRFIVATQDGRTIGIVSARVERGVPSPEDLVLREF
ncbi:MAG TPA: DUF2914 domain-containing protein [Nitrospira sp.]|nr:DUF2914 domain-containing protein [Nitrospira sp.]HNG04026.1 DUF2914 domain-containing protein [Nitrospira sp.]